MNTYVQYLLAYAGVAVLFFCLKPRALRKWFGIALFVLGFALILLLPPFIGSIDVGIFAIAAVASGASLFSSRAKYQD